MTSIQDIECPKEFYLDELPVNRFGSDITYAEIDFGHIFTGIYGYMHYDYMNLEDRRECSVRITIWDDSAGREFLFSQSYECESFKKSPYKFVASEAKKYHIPEIIHSRKDAHELETILEETPGIDKVFEEALRVKKHVIVGEYIYTQGQWEEYEQEEQ